jgi:coenzyme F420-dependent glucose-6-phosphate dehydrogenase
MTAFGYTLSSEEHGPVDLVRNAAKAESLGFDFVSISDHFHPWVAEQGHSPFVWSVLGGVANATEHIDVVVGVTCPIIRIHPAILAQAAATTSLLLDGRFRLGVGTGEALNEHILGHRWPTPGARLEMLEEAVEVMRRLWTGDTVDHHGKYYDVENARLFDPPAHDLPVIVSGFGERAVDLAARIGDGYWGHAPDADVIGRFQGAGGTGPRYAQLNVCWAEDVDEARRTVHRVWPNGGIPGQLSQDLPTWTHFEEAAQLVTEDDAVGPTPCGPEVGPVLDSIDEYRTAGYDHIYLHQVGPDQDGFLRFWNDELGPAVSERFGDD